jgi:nitroreductase
MGELIDLIKQRRSVRNYLDKEVPDSLVQSILEAVQWAPSWANTQCWEVIVVRNQLIKQQLQESVPKANPAHKSIVDAPIVLALCAKIGISGYYKGVSTTKFGDWFMFDIGLMAQNISLAAHALGLATLIVGLYDHDRSKGVLQVPVGFELVALMPLGYASKVPSPPKRKSISEFVHLNTF